jgi:hypothetical protein
MWHSFYPLPESLSVQSRCHETRETKGERENQVNEMSRKEEKNEEKKEQRKLEWKRDSREDNFCDRTSIIEIARKTTKKKITNIVDTKEMRRQKGSLSSFFFLDKV